MINHDDTICAIATAYEPSGIGIIRISGNETKNVVSSIFIDKNKKPISIENTREVKYGYIYDKEKDVFLDEVIIVPMYAPHSYTKEDVIEIQSHGGLLVLKNILNLLIKNGLRIAEPGEFTKRAFLNGRIDLSKAEAVSDLISSKNEYARIASFNQLKGNLSEKLDSFRKKILESIAFIEACLDDPEHIDIEGFKPKLKIQCENIIKELTHILNNYDNGKIIKEGINTVILGKPNVGKSSLLNTLLNEERAIVTDIAGTTRDTIKESINIRGFTLNIIDTAGIRENKDIDKVEKIGIERAKAEAKNADLIILVLDASKSIDADDINLITFCDTNKKKYIILNNKSDLRQDTPSNIHFCTNICCKNLPAIPFSSITKDGYNILLDTIEDLFINKKLDFNNEIFISNERQFSSINKALYSLKNVLSSIEKAMPEDLLTIDLTDAYTNLSQILGIEITDDIVNEIFNKFCMGK